MEEVTKKEMRNRRILAIIAVLVLAFAYAVSGQIHQKKVHFNKDTIVTKYYDVLSFSPVSKKDTTFMYVYGQKNSNSEFFGIGVFYPSGIVLETATLTIGLADNTEVKITPSLVNKENGFVQYILDKSMVHKLSTCGYNQICFNSKTKIVPISWAVRQRYFVDFFVDYYN